MGFGLYRKRFINDKRSTAENDHKAEKEKNMKPTTYAKLSKFVGKPANSLNYSVTEFTEKRIFEYATNRLVAYRTIQDNDSDMEDVKIFNNLKGIKSVFEHYPNIHKLFDSKFDNKGNCDDVSNLIKEFVKAKSVSDKSFSFVLGEKEFYFSTKIVKPAFDFIKALMNDNTELEFSDNNLKLEYNSVTEPLKITFFCLNALVVQILIAPTYNKK